MTSLAIDVVGLSKQYRIGQMHSAIDTLRDHLVHGLRTLRTGRTPRERIWALDDVSFQVREGEVLGIIGRNGAGKTTLLRILSRITEPTRGHADVTGRVGSLLEVGTGFHPELTGRENVFLNGAILGMRRTAIARLCPRLLLLDRGRLIEDGPTDHVIGRYLHGDLGDSARRVWPDPTDAPGDDWARLRSARVVDGGGTTSEVVDVSEQVGIEIAFDLLRREAVFPWIDVVDEGGTLLFSALDTNPVWSEARDPGRYVATAWIPEHLLNEGTLHVTVSVKSGLLGRTPWRHAEVESALTFQVVEREGGPTARGEFPGKIRGPVRPLLRWTSEAVGAEQPLLARPQGA